MISTSKVVDKMIKDSPYLEEALAQGVINCSALARRIKPYVEKELYRQVKEGAILMSLKRRTRKIKSRMFLKKLFKQNPDVIIRSNLAEFTFANSEGLVKKYKTFMGNINVKNKYFLTITHGIFETTIITSKDLKYKIESAFKNERVISKFDNLSSITIKLSKEALSTPGVFYFLLKTLAWEGINVVEVVSTSTEFTIVLDEKNVDKAFYVLNNILKK